VVGINSVRRKKKLSLKVEPRGGSVELMDDNNKQSDDMVQEER
jgi:hypothetical protein